MSETENFGARGERKGFGGSSDEGKEGVVALTRTRLETASKTWSAAACRSRRARPRSRYPAAWASRRRPPSSDTRARSPQPPSPSAIDERIWDSGTSKMSNEKRAQSLAQPSISGQSIKSSPISKLRRRWPEPSNWARFRRPAEPCSVASRPHWTGARARRGHFGTESTRFLFSRVRHGTTGTARRTLVLWNVPWSSESFRLRFGHGAELGV